MDSAENKLSLRVRGAEEAIKRMVAARDYEGFQVDWYGYLTNWKGFFATLEAWAKGSASREAWRKSELQRVFEDQLLNYLYAARNDDEHSLRNPTRLEPGGLLIGSNLPGFSNAIRVDTNPGGQMVVRSLDGLPILTEKKGPSAKLAPVKLKPSGKVINVPKAHQGNSLLDVSPTHVAGLGLAYLAALLERFRSHA